MADAVRYRLYIFQKLRPFLGQRILEIGSGLGQYSRLFLRDGREVYASDVSPEFLEKLRELQRVEPALKCVAYLDLADYAQVRGGLAWNPDTIVCINVLEHVEDDRQSLSWLFECSPPGLRAVFVVPAFQRLYGFMDQQAGHFRRYGRGSLCRAFREAGWSIQASFYVNALGGLGWYVRNHILVPGSRSLDDPAVNSDIRWFDRFGVPVSRMLDPLFSCVFGQSLIVAVLKGRASPAA